MRPPCSTSWLAETVGMDKLEVTAEDGTRLVCWDFGGRGQPVLMLHGTGLHGRCWAPVAQGLGSRLRPLALDMRGHGASGRSPDGSYPWGLFATDALAVIDQLGLSGTMGVTGVGHSAGATALLLAEAARPGTFNRLWVWEPIMAIPGSDLTMHNSVQFAGAARRRRAHFASTEDARAHFEGRGQFAEFAPASLDAFLRGAFVASEEGGLRLACEPEDEARMYEAALAHDAWEQLTEVRGAARVSGGGRSSAVPPDDLARVVSRLPAGTMNVMPALGHFGPFEAPEEIAVDIVGQAATTAVRPGLGDQVHNTVTAAD
jgi:pimeloyl-ACP methyl ester carboxylesterase